MSDSLVHASHCCAHHGCKYGAAECPVLLGAVQQDGPCEENEDDLDKCYPLMGPVDPATNTVRAVRAGVILVRLDDGRERTVDVAEEDQGIDIEEAVAKAVRALLRTPRATPRRDPWLDAPLTAEEQERIDAADGEEGEPW